jgi:hypothetical protein
VDVQDDPMLAIALFPPRAGVLSDDNLQELRENSEPILEDDCDIPSIPLNFWIVTEPQILCHLLEI